MSTTTPKTPVPRRAASTCPAWCDAFHVHPDAEDHVCLIDAVHRSQNLESVAIELEQVPNSPHPKIVLSLFTKLKKPKSMSAGLTIDQARHAYTALGEALRLASDTS